MNTWFMAAATAAIVAVSGTTPLSATAASGPGGATTSAVGAATAPAAGGTYRPIDPYRLLDTRTSKEIPAGGSLTVTAGGIGGLPAAGIGSLALNLTAVSPGSGGWVTAYPTGTAEPNSSNLNLTAGTTTANFSVTRANSAGSFTVVNHSTSSLDVLVDVTGYYLAGAPSGPGAFAPLNPQRVLDTRTGVGAAATSIPAGGSVRLVVAGRGGVPTGAVSAAALNFTVASPATGGYLTAYPTGESEPNASNVNFAAGSTVPNTVLAKVGANGGCRSSTGRVLRCRCWPTSVAPWRRRTCRNWSRPRLPPTRRTCRTTFAVSTGGWVTARRVVSVRRPPTSATA